MISETLLAEIASTHAERLGPERLRELADELREILWMAELGDAEAARRVRELLAEYGVTVVLQ